MCVMFRHTLINRATKIAINNSNCSYYIPIMEETTTMDLHFAVRVIEIAGVSNTSFHCYKTPRVVAFCVWCCVFVCLFPRLIILSSFILYLVNISTGSYTTAQFNNVTSVSVPMSNGENDSRAIKGT